MNITCSEIDSERLAEVVGDVNCASIQNGVDIDYFKPMGNVRRENSLIFIGTMNWYPNVEAVEFVLNEIWSELRELYPDLTFDIVGGSPPDSIKRFDGVDGVKVHGFVDEIRPLFDSAHLYICPIMDGGGTKLKILDAMAMGKAIVAHPVACEGIDVTDRKNVVFCENKKEYVAAIDMLLKNDEQVVNLGENARKLAVENYSFTGIGKRLSDLLGKYA